MTMITTTTTTTATRTDMITNSACSNDLALFLWLSPAFPVGAFAYSHGLEWAVEAGDIVDALSLRLWLEDLSDHGAPRADATLFAAAHRAVSRQDWIGLNDANELAIALAGSMERRLETSAQGLAFLLAARAAWDCEALAHLPAAGGDPVAYAVAVAAASAGHGFRLESALPAFVVAVFANLVSAAVRLSAIGQTDGQRVLAALLPRLAAMAGECAGADLEALGGCTFRSDLAALRHETQYSRLFRT
jgi:urease accessory protein